VAVVVVVVVASLAEVQMGGHFEAEGVVEATAKVVVDQAEVEEAGMVVVAEAADMEAHHGHIVAEGGEELAAGAEGLAQVQQSKMLR
jgi:dihydropteroate synthase